MRIKLLLIVYIFQFLCCKATAQAYYMHEVAEDSDGSPINGIIGLLFLIGLVVVIDKLRGKTKNENYNNSHNEGYKGYVKTDVYVKSFDRCLDDTSVNKKENNFEEKVIRMYGNQTECFGGLLIIREDGEYHYLSINDDERYRILNKYLLEHKAYNCTDSTIKVDWELIRIYMMLHKKEFKPFNPIENANIEKNDFLGGKLLALKSYYEKNTCCGCGVVKLEFFLSIGWHETILLHKIIKRPMGVTEWFDMRVMQLKGFKTYEEYNEYRKTAGQFHEEEDGWYDGFYGYLAPTFNEAGEIFQKKEGYTYMAAYEEIDKIRWEL